MMAAQRQTQKRAPLTAPLSSTSLPDFSFSCVTCRGRWPFTSARRSDPGSLSTFEPRDFARHGEVQRKATVDGGTSNPDRYRHHVDKEPDRLQHSPAGDGEMEKEAPPAVGRLAHWSKTNWRMRCTPAAAARWRGSTPSVDAAGIDPRSCPTRSRTFSLPTRSCAGGRCARELALILMSCHLKRLGTRFDDGYEVLGRRHRSPSRREMPRAPPRDASEVGRYRTTTDRGQRRTRNGTTFHRATRC
jgi:hypothetical protein